MAKPISYRHNPFSDVFSPWSPFGAAKPDTFKMDVREEILHYTVEAEMAGIDKEDIDISFEDRTLTVGICKGEQEGKYLKKERRACDMQRSVYLPGSRADGITAALNNGLLLITVPKNETPQTRSIKIQ